MISTRKYKDVLPHAPTEFLIGHLQDAARLNKDPAVARKLKECLRIVVGMDNYLEEMSPEETPVQKRILEDTYNEPWEKDFEAGKVSYVPSTNMVSGYAEGQFLRIAGQITRAKKVLEIGTFTGYGAVSFAQSSYCEEVVCLEYEPYFKEFIASRIKGTSLQDKIRVITGAAMDSLHDLKEQGQVFDLVFIDADKGNYINYYNYIMDNGLLSPSGTILVDNTLWKSEVFPTPSSPTGQAVHVFNKHVRDDKRVNSVILPMNDGVTIIHPVEESP